MNFRGDPNRRSRVEATLELTPLIDVIFLLLIFFVMTTTPAMSTVEKLDVDLPGADSAQAVDTEPQVRVVLRVHPDGRIEIHDGDASEAETITDLERELSRLYRESPQATIWIQGDVDASHGAVVDLLDATRQVGFERVHMAVRPD